MIVTDWHLAYHKFRTVGRITATLLRECRGHNGGSQVHRWASLLFKDLFIEFNLHSPTRVQLDFKMGDIDEGQHTSTNIAHSLRLSKTLANPESELK